MQTSIIVSQALQQASAEDSGGERKAEGSLKHAVALVKAVLAVHERNVPAKLTETVLELHDQALLALTGMPGAQEAVAKLCMDYWTLEAPNAIHVTVQMVPSLMTL
jgi:hypothetical protein